MKTGMDGRGISLAYAAIGLMALVCAGSAAQADDEVAAFYAGKTVHMMVGTSPGGGVDLIGRLVARHLQNHIPGKPTIVVQNVPGAGGNQMANHLFASGCPRRDGDRRAAQRDADRAAADAEGVAVRSDAVHVDRQHVPVEQCRLRLAQVAGAEPGGAENQGGDRRHVGAGLRFERPVDPGARRARAEIPDRARLQERHRDQYRHGARRGSCPDRRLGFS